MSMIEGVGDEVTVVAAITTVLLVALTTYLYRNLRLRDTLNFDALHIWYQYVVPQVQATNSQSINSTRVITTATESSVPEPDSSTTDESSRTQSEITTISESEVSSSSADITAEVIETVSEESQPETLVENSNTQSHDSDAASASLVTNDDVEQSRPTTNLNSGDAESVPSDEIQVRLKYLNDTEKLVKTRSTETIGSFKRVHFESDLNENKVVRLIFNGQLLRDNMTLQSYRIEDRTVLHVHVSQAQPQPNYSTTGMQSDLDISSYMWPLFSIILAFCWIMYIRYPEFFSVTSIILLVAFSASFFVVYVHSQVQYP